MPAQSIVFSTQLPVRWGDLDALNHVNHACFFTYMEQARLLWWAQNNFIIDRTSTGPILAHVSCDYLQPLTFPSTIKISLSLSDLGRSSFNINYLISSEKDTGIIFAKGKTTVVWVNYQQKKSIPLPEDIKQLFSDAN